MSTTTYPRAGHEQALSALALANRVRTHNAQLLKKVAALQHPESCEAAAEILRSDMRSPAGAIPAYRLLCAVRYLEEARATRLLRMANVFNAMTALRSLTERQRATLADALDAVAANARRRR